MSSHMDRARGIDIETYNRENHKIAPQQKNSMWISYPRLFLGNRSTPRSSDQQALAEHAGGKDK